MILHRYARTTARAALALSSLALAAGPLGCERHADEATREPTRAAAAGPAASLPSGGEPQPASDSKLAATPVAPTPAAPKPSSPEHHAVATSTPAKAGEAPQVTRASSAAGALELRRLVVTRAIENREPVAMTEFFADGEPILAFLDLRNPGDGPTEVVVTFEHESGESVGHVSLEIPAKSRRWRTWARTRLIKKTGGWVAVVRSADGKELARREFEVRARTSTGQI